MQTAFATARTLLTLTFLTYASFSDYKTREVSNSLWILVAPPAFALTFVELFLYEPAQLLLYGLCFGLTTAIAVILFYSGGFGGADAKALMCLAIAFPFYPENLFTPILGSNSPISQIFFPITVFSNSVLITVVIAISYCSLSNIKYKRTGKKLFEEGHSTEPLRKKILVFITGCKKTVDELKEKSYLYPFEDIEEDAENTFRRKLVLGLIPKDEDRNAIVGRLAEAVETGKIKNKVWATHGLPLLISITVGFIIALFLGDVVWICVRWLLG